MKFFRLVFRWRWLVVVVCLVLTFLLGWPIQRLSINADLTSYLPRTDPAVETLEHVADTYGANFLAVIALEAEDIFSPPTLESIHDLTVKLQMIDGVNYVTSLTNILDLKKTEEGLEIGKLINEDDFPFDGVRAKALRDYVLTKKRFRGRLVSADGRSTLIIVALRKGADKTKVIGQIEGIIHERPWPGRLHLAGLPFQLHEISQYIIKDLKVLSPVVAVVVLLCLYLSFRCWRRVLISLAAVGLSTIWTLGIMSLVRVPLTIISDAIPVLLLAIGSAYSIHVISRFDEAPAGQKEKALAHVSTSVLLAALTTMAGFLSFVFGSYLSAIREFGVFAAVGIILALVLSLTFVPAALSLTNSWKPKRPGDSAPKKEISPLLRRLEKWSLAFLRRPKLTLAVFSLVIVVALLGLPQVKRHSKMLDYFEASTTVRQSEDFLEKRFGGSIPVHILIKGDIQNPAVLSEMKELEAFLEKDPAVHNPLSIADYLAEMNDLMGEGERVPETREKVSNLLFLLEGQEGLDQLLVADKTEAVIQATIPSLDVGAMKELVKRIEGRIKKSQLPGVKMTFSGSPLVYIHLDRNLIQSQFFSLALALGLIYLCVFFLVRSPTAALLGMLPISFTLILVFGLMGYAAIPLDIATVLVGSVSIGIGIDYALHWLNRFRWEIALLSSLEHLADKGMEFSAASGPSPSLPLASAEKKGSPSPSASSPLIAAVEKTLRSAGKAIFINMVTVALGFLVLLLGNLIPLRRFGLLVAVTMLSSGLGALTLLPAVVVGTKARWLNLNREKRKQGGDGPGGIKDKNILKALEGAKAAGNRQVRRKEKEIF